MKTKTRQERIQQFDQTDLYVVITEFFCAGRPAREILDACLQAGVRLIQMREKDISTAELHQRAQVFRQSTAEANALLIINDRVDIALAVGADGVHLGQDDLPLEAARRIAPDLLLGASTHNLQEAQDAQAQDADYINIGPIFPTQTKSLAIPALGPEALPEITPHINIPFTCMGGIKHDNIRQVLQHGAKHPAVVTAVTAAPDPKSAAETLRQKIIQRGGEATG